MRPPLLLALALALLLVASCGRPASTPEDGGTVPAPPSDQLDILFVVDNSNSDFGDGAGEQRLSTLLGPLAAVQPTLSVHVGVVTTDLGAGAFTPPSCDPIGGDQGQLWNRTWATACTQAHLTDPTARFVAFTLGADGGALDTNFVGGIDEVFDCYRQTGSGGCGYEHSLGSPRAALAGCNTPGGCVQAANEGFLRPDAYLLLVVMSAEDDCSVPPDSTLFDPTQYTLTAPLGPLTSYRCFEFGVRCGGQDVGRGASSYTDCAPGNKDPDPHHQLVSVETFAHDFKSLKRSPRMVYTAVFAGQPTRVAVGLDANGYPDLQPSCTCRPDAIYWGAADPGIRLEAFTQQFDADRARFYDACTATAEESFVQIGSDLAVALQGD